MKNPEIWLTLGWYPALWLILIVLYRLSNDEEALSHDAMTDRAVYANNLTVFLAGDRFWSITILAVYIICGILYPIIPFELIMLIILFFFASLMAFDNRNYILD